MSEENIAPTTEQETPTTESDVDVDLSSFLDEDTTQIEEEPEDKPVEEPIEEEVPEEETKAEPAPFLTIKYNKESRNLSQEEAVELAQKGMNYDRIHEQYESLKQYEGLNRELESLAQANGMSVNDYIANLKEVQSAFELNREIESLKETYQDADESLLNELAQSRLNQRREGNIKEAQSKAESEKSSLREEVERQVNKFEERYPDVAPDKLDQEVYDLMKRGYTLLEAYEVVQGEKRKAEERVREQAALSAKQNEENKKKSLGNLNNTGDIEKNAFMEAFLSDD